MVMSVLEGNRRLIERLLSSLELCQAGKAEAKVGVERKREPRKLVRGASSVATRMQYKSKQIDRRVKQDEMIVSLVTWIPPGFGEGGESGVATAVNCEEELTSVKQSAWDDWESRSD